MYEYNYICLAGLQVVLEQFQGKSNKNKQGVIHPWAQVGACPSTIPFSPLKMYIFLMNKIVAVDGYKQPVYGVTFIKHFRPPPPIKKKNLKGTHLWRRAWRTKTADGRGRARAASRWWPVDSGRRNGLPDR